MANGTDAGVAEFLHWVGDAFLLLLTALLGLAWNTKPNEARVTEMIEASADDLKEHVDLAIKAHRELMDEKLRRIEEGTIYSNRLLERIEKKVDERRGR